MLFLSGKLLDFGCGRKPYKHLFSFDEYIGLDIVESGHNHEDEEIDVYYDGTKIPFDRNYFDCVFASEVFEHVFNIDEVLKEINRVCKQNGHLLITVPFVWDEHEIPYDFERYTSYGIKHLLEKHGFEIVNLMKTTNYIETIFQMLCAYISQHILRKKIVQILLNPLLISPIMILGIFKKNIS